jgi:aminoglycoside phosphotransferase family enzyme/predicted kinase
MNLTSVQQDVFAFLSDPATYGGVTVKRIDTHAASVFLAGSRALKVKRAVRFPFLDFSTLAKRRAACEAEIEANRPFAPELYHGVTPITREADRRFAIGGKGKPVEWAVDMWRFDETQTLDQIADRSGIDIALADQLARTIAAAHARAPVVEDAPWIEALASYIGQNETAFAASEALYRPSEREALTRASFAALRKVRPLLIIRGRAGLVRRGHGDLHLGNIALIDGKPVPFDAVEFDPLIAAGDVLYDLAFLLMDLVERDLALAGNVVLNRYLAETRRLEDYDGLAAMPLFLSVRAAIRAKVTAARPIPPDSDGGAIAEAARKYFALACKAIEPPPPLIVAIGGLSGTGKSILARMLASHIEPLPGAVILRSDTKRKAIFGVAETATLPIEAYTTEVTDYIYTSLFWEVQRPVAAGHSAVVDAVFARAEQRWSIAEAARLCGVRFVGLFLTAGLETRVDRVKERMHDASDADETIARRQENYELGVMDWTTIDASGTPEETLARVLEHLERVGRR